MPIHDWTRVTPNRFHHFHQKWTMEIADAMNRGLMPPGYFALAEQRTGGPEPDVIALSIPNFRSEVGGGLSLAEVPVKTQYIAKADAVRYAEKANRIKVHSSDGDVVAIIEIVSPGNKASRHAVKSFVRKAIAFLRAGIHVQIVDLFPPGKRDPDGLHKLIWDYLDDDDLERPADKPLTLASYSAGREYTAFVEFVAVRDALPVMPVFLTPDEYVNVPLEETYLSSWDAFPQVLKAPLEA